ncbi:MAG: hypothetical protein ACKOW9_01440 [Candidatus Paceibacterota bacterium]
MNTQVLSPVTIDQYQNEWSDKVKLLPLPDDQVVLVQDGIQKII